jgi:hypothetical protein
MAKLRGRPRYPLTAEGQELTPEVIEALAAEAERGYDISQAQRAYIAGPLLADQETPARLLIWVDNDELNQVRKRAEAEGRSISELGREALRRYMDS